MKKLVLKKSSALAAPTREYKIRYADELNPAQYEAVMHSDGAALVIAGAGTGKTRTLVYRVARLIEDGIAPESILLLTFTRKSANEMLRRAGLLLDGRCERVSGGTFHSFANQILRRFAPLVGFERSYTILDQGDAEDTINLLRAQMGFEKLKKRFPMKQTLQNIHSAAVNRCLSIQQVVEFDYPQFAEQIPGIEELLRAYHNYKRKHNVLDYDDMLVYLMILLREHAEARGTIQRDYRYTMVDEYQDTNTLQHDIVLQLSGPGENIMAVGDDAQSIYSFRGANYQNIMKFPESFRYCKVIAIEENYRSTQPILNFANELIHSAAFKYDKNLYTKKSGGELPAIISAKDERMQSLFVVQQILALREEGTSLKDMSVLIRSGFLSFDLEIELNRANIPFRKFGGLKFMETAHIKDILALFRIIYNPRDLISWHRILLLLEGVGPRTAADFVEGISEGRFSLRKGFDMSAIPRGKAAVEKLLNTLREAEPDRVSVGEKAMLFAEFYRPLLQKKYDDFPKRWKDVEMFLTIAERYASMPDFLSDMALEPPNESVSDLEAEGREEEFLTISTIHSAKGLEWNSVFLIWALDGRFPSTRSVENIDSLEEERRLLYVACTRAKERLYISYPVNIFDRELGFVLSKPSRFLDGIQEDVAERFMLMAEEE